MTEDKKTVHLIIILAFLSFLIGEAAPPVYKSFGIDGGSAVQGGLSMAGIFLALLARTRSDSQPVTVENTTEHPVPTEPQPPIAPQTAPEPPQTATAPIEPVSPEDALPEPPPVAVRN